jgi:CRP-like cAMP-binding protein
MRALDKQVIHVLDGAGERQIRSLGPLRTFKRGATLFPLRTVPVLIESGLVKLTAIDGEHETIVSVHGVGDLLGAERVLNALCDVRPGVSAGGPEITAMALTSGSVRVLRAQALESFFLSHPKALATLALGLHERLEDAQARIHSAAWDSAARRLARLLCDLERYGFPYVDRALGKGIVGTRLPIDLTRPELASWIGASSKTVDRAMVNWEHRRIISRYASWVVVHDLGTLAHIAGISVRRRAYAGIESLAG